MRFLVKGALSARVWQACLHPLGGAHPEPPLPAWPRGRLRGAPVAPAVTGLLLEPSEKKNPPMEVARRTDCIPGVLDASLPPGEPAASGSEAGLGGPRAGPHGAFSSKMLLDLKFL